MAAALTAAAAAVSGAVGCLRPVRRHAGAARHVASQAADRWRGSGHQRPGQAERGGGDDRDGSGGGGGDWVKPATPRMAFGEHGAFPTMLVGNFATRKPRSPSYFMGNSKLDDFLQSVDDYCEAAKKLTKYPEIRYSRELLRNYRLLSHERLQRQFGIALDDHAYRMVIGKVKSILSLSPLPPKFAQFAQRFLTESCAKSTAFNSKPLLDDDGVAHSWGSRKNARVRCKMVEGTGEILYNGRTLLDVYPTRPGYRETILQPLIATETLGKYNIWLDVDMSRGGLSGRAEAARLAVSHGLALHRPELLTILDQLGWIRPDPRTRERKKAGQPGARKKKQWVKR